MTEKITAEEFVKKLYETAGNDLVIRHDPENRQINLTIRSEGSVGNQFVTDAYSDGTLPSQRATAGYALAPKSDVEHRSGIFCKNAVAEARQAVRDLGWDERMTDHILVGILEKDVCFHIAVKHEEPQVTPRKLAEAQTPFNKSKDILKGFGLEPDVINKIVVKMANARIIHYEPGEEPR